MVLRNVVNVPVAHIPPAPVVVVAAEKCRARAPADSVVNSVDDRTRAQHCGASLDSDCPCTHREANAESRANAELTAALPETGIGDIVEADARSSTSESVGRYDSTASTSSTSRAKTGLRRTSSAQSKFWKPAVHRLYSVYVEQRLGLICENLSQLDARHWRQIIDFIMGLRKFLAQAPDQEDPPPPALPQTVLLYILDSFSVRKEGSPDGNDLAEPLWYLEAVMFFRFLLQPSQSVAQPAMQTSNGDDGGAAICNQEERNTDGQGAPRRFTDGSLMSSRWEAKGKGAPEDDRQQIPRSPSRTVQFLVHVVGSSAFAACMFTMGSLGRQALAFTEDGNVVAGTKHILLVMEAAWARHGGDLLLACQHVLMRLYPDPVKAADLGGPRNRLAHEDVPSLVSVLVAASIHFSAQGLAVSYMKGQRQPELAACTSACSANTGQQPQEPASGRLLQFANVMRDMGLFDQDVHGSADRFLMCLRDVLHQLLGPCPANPENLPSPLPAECQETDDVEQTSLPEIRTLARIARTVILALFTDPARLAASEAAPCRVDTLAVGSFAGPSDPGDFVPVPDQGPLRRNLAFMEQSPLLQVVQGKLCAAKFEDVSGSNDQLEFFAVRNLRVLWFDLRKCTSTLKRMQSSMSESGKPGSRSSKATSDLALMLRNLRLCLVHDWEAKLATFPFLHLSGSSQVTVRSLSICLQLGVSYGAGVKFQDVEVGAPDLGVQLQCESTFSQVMLSAILKMFLPFLEDIIRKQFRSILLQLLRHEGDKWNSSYWHKCMDFVPERLVSVGLKWIGANIPPEGLPI